MDISDERAITILHFNDVYNIDSSTPHEPIGGACRFLTAINEAKKGLDDTIVIFSGDAFSPSMLSTFTKGEQMVPVLNKVGTTCAVFGNHDFDHGLDVLAQWTEKSTFPWLMSNVVDNETGRPLGGGKITHIINHKMSKIGLIGLVEKEWLDTLPTIDPNEVTFIDFVKAGNQLSEELKNGGCNLIIAITHMRTPNDKELAKSCGNIDLILGGHDHDYEITNVNEKYIIKSGTDFRQFSKVRIDPQRDVNGKIKVDVKPIEVTGRYAEDMELKEELKHFSEAIESKMSETLGVFTTELDGRFAYIRTSETSLGNWICDVALSATGADLVMINSGTFRSDRIHQPGPFTMKDLVTVVPMQDPLMVLEVPGNVLHEALENGVSGYPKLEGRFPQVSGVSFTFDPSKPPGKRVNPKLVQVADDWLNFDQMYAVCIKSYMHTGCDGYKMLKECKLLMDEDSCPELALAIQNHFKAIEVRLGKKKHSRHRQSLISLSRRHSMIQMFDSFDLDGPSPVRRISISRMNSVDHSSNNFKMYRRASLDDLELESCQLAPSIQHRIIKIESEDHLRQLLLQRETQENNSVITEVDEPSQ